MAWPGTDPLAFYRSLIDSVDHDLGELLNRRAAITAAVQPHKKTPERDLDREREIARALALRAPALGEDRLYRIVHQIISESLDAGGILRRVTQPTRTSDCRWRLSARDVILTLTRRRLRPFPGILGVRRRPPEPQSLLHAPTIR